MSEQPYIKNGVERLRHRMEVLDGSPMMTVPPEIIREVLTRLEQAEQDRDKLRNRLDAMRRQRYGYRNQLRKTEQQVARVRVELGYIPEDFSARIRRALDGDTRRLADQGLGDNLARTTKNGENNE